jgi:hypothetical protein
MRTVILLIAFCLLSFSPLLAQTIDSMWLVNNYYKIERKIPMRDGVKLFTSIYVPKSKIEKHPILITRTPYSCKPYGENNLKDYWNSYQREYLKEGYIMVTQDVRGRWMSEGKFENVRPFNPGKQALNTWPVPVNGETGNRRPILMSVTSSVKEGHQVFRSGKKKNI